MQLKELQHNWDTFGRVDPLWAILTVPGKADNKWNTREFFETGVEEIRGVLRYVESLGLPCLRKRALDFGCGVGRLTQALCRYFDECCGVDIAPSMIQRATQYNRYGRRCQYLLNESEDLRTFPNGSMGFVYSNIVLQHMRPEYSSNYIREFVRVLSPGGVAVFQIPAKPNYGEETGIIVGRAAHLPENGFRAEIVPHQSVLKARTGSRINVKATVWNRSSETWRSASSISQCPIRLGNHWDDEEGKRVQIDDARTNLEHELVPGEGADFDLVVTAPANPGKYVLVLDMVQEFVDWFATRGSPVSTIPVTVDAPSFGAGQETSLAETANVPARMEMYALSRECVEQIITAAGAVLRDVQPDKSAGDEWEGFRYCVFKPDR